MLEKITSGDIHFKELLKGGVFSFILRIFGTLLGFLVTLATTRYYGIDSLGVVTILFNLLQFVVVLGKSGIDLASLRLIATYNATNEGGKIKMVYWQTSTLILISSLVISLVLFFSADFIAKTVFNKGYLAPYIQWSSFVVIPLSLMHLNRESLRGLKKIPAFSFLNTSSIGFFSLLLLGIVQFSNTDPVVPIIVQNVAIVLSFLLSIFLWIRTTAIFPVSSTDHTGIKKIYSLALPLFIGSFLLLINTTASSFILGIFKDEAEVGLFNIAQKIAAVCNISIVAINSIAAPKFSEMYASGKKDEFKKVIRTSSKLIFWSTFPVIIFILLFHRFILSFFGTNLEGALPVLFILVLGQLVNAVAGSVGLILQMSGEQKAFRNIAVYTSIVNIGLNFLLIPLWGVIGAAIVSSVAYCFWNIVAVITIRSKLGILTVYNPFQRN